MKVLVATHLTQGSSPDDFCFTLDGELVTPLGVFCSDQVCGCRRAFPGLGSSMSTTTAMVVDLPHIDDQVLEDALRDSLLRRGYLGGLSLVQQVTMILEHAGAVRQICARYPVGTVLARSDHHVYLRTSLAA